MDTFCIVNGVRNEGIHQNIEKYAFCEGILSCSLEEYFSGGMRERGKAFAVFIDLEGMSRQKADAGEVWAMPCPVIMVPTSVEEMYTLSRESVICNWVEYPFGLYDFRESISYFLEEQQEKNRTLYFGRLVVNRSCRTAMLDGKELELRGYNYDILLILLKHMGEAVSREYINQSLPRRQRNSARNVDTHIKQLRRELGMKDVIQSIRKIGYCIPKDLFYQRMRGGFWER